MHNVMLRCAACGRTLAEQAAWKGSGERYYCNEFCADAEGSESPSLVPTLPEDAPARVQRRRTGALEQGCRLGRNERWGR